MLKPAAALALALTLAACATGPEPYRAASGPNASGYSEQAIESDRFRVAYRADDAATARDYALLRAAELTLEQGGDWFRIVSSYSQGEDPFGRTGGTSVSVGGSSGSYGSSVGVGVGIGLGGGRDEETVHVVELLVGSGPKPDGPDVYDARAVHESIGAAALAPS